MPNSASKNASPTARTATSNLLHAITTQPQLLASFLRTLLSAEKHPAVVGAKQRILIALLGRCAVERLEQPAIVQQLVAGLCRQGGPGANRVGKALMQRLLPTAVVHRLLSDEFLSARSARFTENALRMVLFALMTFPSTYFDIRASAACAIRCATDRRRRVRRAALDVLAVLGQIGSTQLVLDVLRAEQQAGLLLLSTAPQRIGNVNVVVVMDGGGDDEHGQQRLSAAIKARLSRRQLPLVSADGNVQYALRIPAAHHPATPPDEQQPHSGEFGADIEWIMAGIGSVSPTSLKRRKRIVAVEAKQEQQPFDSGR